MDQPKTIKFDMNTDYNLILSFDEPKEFDGKYGKSIMYGAKLSGEEVRFYASPGLHEEIQSQQLKKGAKCAILKTRDKNVGDFDFFVVNGKSKHKLMSVEDFKQSAEPTFQNAPGSNDNDLTEKVNKLWEWMESCKKKAEVDEEIPF